MTGHATNNIVDRGVDGRLVYVAEGLGNKIFEAGIKLQEDIKQKSMRRGINSCLVQSF